MPETEDNGKVAHVEGRAVWIAGREGGADLGGVLVYDHFAHFARVHLGKSRGTPVYPGYGVEKRCFRGRTRRCAPGIEKCIT